MRKVVLAFLAAVVFMTGCNQNGPVDPGTDGGVTAKWFISRGAPSDDQGVDGDLYLDTDTTVLYVKTEGAWVNVATLQGAAGAGWLFGTGAPSSSLGEDGDLYLDTASTMAYKKSGGGWSYLFTLRGEEGEAGADGTAWFTGFGDPNAEEPPGANEGDLYLDVLTTLVYRKDTVAWSVVLFFQAAVVPQYAFTPHLSDDDLHGVTYGLMEDPPVVRVVAVGSGGLTAFSDDGTSWYLLRYGWGARGSQGPAGDLSGGAGRGVVDTVGDSHTSANLRGVAFGEGVFVAVGDPEGGDGYSVWTSLDVGEGWSADETTPQADWYLSGVTYTGGKFVAFGQVDGTGESLIIYSAYGDDWEVATYNGESGDPRDYVRGVAYGDGQFVAVTEGGYILVSTDGETWTRDYVERPDYVDPYLYGVTYANGLFVAVGYSDYDGTPAVLLSGDGLEWISQDLPIDVTCDDELWYYPLSGVANGTGGLVAAGVDYEMEDNGETLEEVPHLLVLNSPTGASWSVQRWDGYASGVCWTPINGGLYIVARGDVRLWHGPYF